MANIYEEVEIEDMKFNEEEETFTYPCPCGDRFSITLEELLEGEEIALCPSCTLRIRVIYEPDNLESFVQKRKEETIPKDIEPSTKEVEPIAA